MMQNLQTPQLLAAELLDLKKAIEPLDTRAEEVKAALRGFGAAEYAVPNVGVVTVTRPGERRLTGKKLIVDDTMVDKVDPTIFASLLNLGFLKWEEQYSRATKAKVEAKLHA